MSKVGHPNNPENKGETNADYGVHAPEQQAIEDKLKQNIHGLDLVDKGGTPEWVKDAPRILAELYGANAGLEFGNRRFRRVNSYKFAVLPLHQERHTPGILSIGAKLQTPAGSRGAKRDIGLHERGADDILVHRGRLVESGENRLCSEVVGEAVPRPRRGAVLGLVFLRKLINARRGLRICLVLGKIDIESAFNILGTHSDYSVVHRISTASPDDRFRLKASFLHLAEKEHRVVLVRSLKDHVGAGSLKPEHKR